MSSAFTVDECDRCGHAMYPPRILCPRCAGSRFHRRLAEAGTVTEITTRRPVAKRRQLPWGDWLDQSETRLAAVRSDAGPRIIARVDGDAEVGDRVILRSESSTAIALPGQTVEASRA